MTSSTFSAKAGSLDRLKVRMRCGWRRCVSQMRWTVRSDRPTALAMARPVQWVASPNGLPWVSASTLATVAVGTGFLPGGRVLWFQTGVLQHSRNRPWLGKHRRRLGRDQMFQLRCRNAPRARHLLRRFRHQRARHIVAISPACFRGMTWCKPMASLIEELPDQRAARANDQSVSLRRSGTELVLGLQYRPPWPECRSQDPRGRKARQFPGEPSLVREPASCACLGDAVDPAAFLLGRDNCEPEFLLESTREDAAHGVRLPPRCCPHLLDRGTLGAAQ